MPASPASRSSHGLRRAALPTIVAVVAAAASALPPQTMAAQPPATPPSAPDSAASRVSPSSTPAAESSPRSRFSSLSASRAVSAAAGQAVYEVLRACGAGVSPAAITATDEYDTSDGHVVMLRVLRAPPVVSALPSDSAAVCPAALAAGGRARRPGSAADTSRAADRVTVSVKKPTWRDGALALLGAGVVLLLRR